MANVPRSGSRRLRDSWPDSRRTFNTSNVWPRRRWNGWVTVAEPKERLASSALRWVCGDAQRPEFAVGLRYVYAPDRVRSVSLLPERKRQFAQPSLDPVRFDGLEVLTVHARRALVGATLGIGVRQNVFAADLVVEGVEAVAGFSLRFRVQRRLQFLNAIRS